MAEQRYSLSFYIIKRLALKGQALPTIVKGKARMVSEQSHVQRNP
jgi:hypothetical protein